MQNGVISEKGNSDQSNLLEKFTHSSTHNKLDLACRMKRQ